MAEQRQPAAWMLTTDEAILEELEATRLDYPALIAGRRGMLLSHVEKRCEVLAAYGLIEPTSAERTYRLTARGRAYLDGELDAATLRDEATACDGE